METDRLRYFTIIAETGSLTKASQILGVSHSGLSKTISALEAETKTKLFRPQGRGLEITPEGKWFYQKAREIIAITDEILQGQKEKTSLVRIGFSSVIAITCSGIIAAEFDEAMSFSEIDVGELEGKIISGELDFGIAFIPSPRPELEYLEIGEVIFNSYVREDLAKQTPGEELSYVVPISDFSSNPLGYKARDGWPQDVLRTPHFSVSAFAIALNLLRAGQAAIYMPDFVAILENQGRASGQHFVVIKEHKAAETTRKVFLVKRQANEESKAMKKTVKIIRRVCCSRKGH